MSNVGEQGVEGGRGRGVDARGCWGRGHGIRGGGETNPSTCIWGKGGGGFGGMRENRTATRSRLRRGWGLAHKKLCLALGATVGLLAAVNERCT